VGVDFGLPHFDGELEELGLLAETAGLTPVARITCKRKAPDAALFVGSGKADEIKELALMHGATEILFDQSLSPAQQRNLERHMGVAVNDRTLLILEIFAQRARSHEGKLQVELAQLKHLQTRLVRGWTHLERQKGGIGLRGPGETQLETDRRLLNNRVRTLNRRLEKLALQRDTGRHTRKQVPVPGAALVGYTNAGKSTLFNLLTGADGYVADQLFATLDPTVRRLKLPHCPEMVLADTVGFVRDLPHELIAAFRSTLLEAREADVHLHVIDCADPERAERISQVLEVLASIGAGDVPTIEVYNKADLIGERPRVERDEFGRVRRVWLSAATGEGVDLLKEALAERFGVSWVRRSLHLEARHGRARAELFRRAAVLSEQITEQGGWILEVELSERDLQALCRREGIDLPVLSDLPCVEVNGFLQSPPSAVSLH
jgi:GTP-binding protein HflX